MKTKPGLFDGPIVMLFSAAIFGFFGFSRDWAAPFPDGRVVLFMVLLGWTLRISACLFLVAGVIAFMKPIVGHLLYALTSVASAGLFVVVVVMDVTDTAHMIMPYGEFVLLFFAAWNGYGSWSALRSILGRREHVGVLTGGPEPAGGQ